MLQRCYTYHVFVMNKFVYIKLKKKNPSDFLSFTQKLYYFTFM